MPSKLKSETARVNGAKSRGPKTAEGLEKSSRNAVKHGFTSGSAVVLACENPAGFQIMMDTFMAKYQPANPAEIDLVEEMVVTRWRIRRLWTVETCLLDAEILKQEVKSETGNPGAHLALAFRALADESRALHLASRYESRLHRIYDRAYQTLRELQQSRTPVASPCGTGFPACVPDSGSVAEPPASVPAEKPNEPTSAAPKELSTPREAGSRPAPPAYPPSDTLNASSTIPANEILE